MERKYTVKTGNEINYDSDRNVESPQGSCPTAITIKDEHGLEKCIDQLGDLGC